MRLISFNAFRTLDVPGVRYIKPESFLGSLDHVREAEWVLYPEYWQVNSLVYGLKRRIFPSIASYHLGHDKIEQTRAFMAVAPAHVPWTEILPATDASIDYVLEWFSFPFVAKVVRSSMGEGVYLVASRREFLDYAAQNDILYIQEYLPIERDLRVVWVGDEVVSAYWREGSDGFHNNVARGGVLSFDDVPPVALELVSRVARELGVDHAGFDVAVVEGHCYLLEFNLMFGLDGLNRQGVKVGEYVSRYLGLAGDDEPTHPTQPGPVVAA
ncbi:MAG: ATP-grasp domain-containing protein [Pseudomonadota bacterium]